MYAPIPGYQKPSSIDELALLAETLGQQLANKNHDGVLECFNKIR
ncbi:MAG: hypothetical protein EZS28_017896, partial [Streblomastix strix]